MTIPPLLAERSNPTDSSRTVPTHVVGGAGAQRGEIDGPHPIAGLPRRSFGLISAYMWAFGFVINIEIR
jgi:hypothetical protein